jgi:glycine/D-amino acid oxidase-like deaminating enzyme
MTPALEISPWITVPPDLQAPLAGDRTANVVVIGAGFAGLSAALALKRAGVDVVVLEREFAGFGASGRNAGHLTPTIGKDLPTLLMLFGPKRTAQYVDFAEQAVHGVSRALQEHRIDCDYVPCGNIMAAVHRRQEARLRKAAGVAARVGAHVQFLDRAEMQRRQLPPAFISGALEESGGTLDPGKYVNGLRRAVLEAKIPLHERTPVLELLAGARPRVRTPAGTVTADTIILATNAYTLEFGRLHSVLFPLHDTLFETAPLDAGQLAALGWPGREGIYTAHESLESYRLTARRTIIGGAKGVRYPYGSALRGGSSDWTIALNIAAFRERFPTLTEVHIAHTWGGWIDMTANFLPVLGTLGRHRNVHYVAGFNGHGIAAASALGNVVADVVLRRPNPYAGLFTPFVVPLPPEPLRWLILRGMIGLVNTLDRRIDAQVRDASRALPPPPA